MIVSFTRSTNNLKTNLFSISFPQFWRKSLIVWHSNIRIISWAFFSHHRKMPLLSELRNILNLLDITILTSLLKCQYQLVLWICIWQIWASRLRPKTINYKATILSNPIQSLRVYKSLKKFNLGWRNLKICRLQQSSTYLDSTKWNNFQLMSQTICKYLLWLFEPRTTRCFVRHHSKNKNVQ